MMQKLSERVKMACSRVSFQGVWFVVGLALVALFLASLLFFYLTPRDSVWVSRVTNTLPYPIVIVGTSGITERALAQNMDSVKRFYENQDFASMGLRVDFTTDEGKKRLRVREREVLNKMVEDRAVEQIAKNRGIQITDEEVKEDIKNRIESYGTGNEVVVNLERLYGWSLKEFADKVVKPSLYQDKLIVAYEQEVDQKEARTKIEAAEKEIAGGLAFSEAAAKYSEGSTRETGGELGWFQLTDLAPELQATVQNARLNAATVIQESSLGYHIILVHEVKNEEALTLYRISQIFVKKITFSEWLTGEMQKMNIYVWSPFYKWNHERAEVDFANGAWQQYEQTVYQNATQDALFTN